ncbi:MAG: biotin/lipoyl-binding protein [Lysobacterales bacterium]
MKRFYILPLLAIIGLGIAIATIFYGNKAPGVMTREIPQFQPPFEFWVAGAGIVEATTGNISIGTPVSGIVMEIYVKVGDHVQTGDPLFKIDDRALHAQLLTADARVTEATAALQKPKHRLKNAEQLKKRDPNAISDQNLGDLLDEAAQAEATLVLARTQLVQLQVEIERHTVRALVPGEVLQLRMRLGEYVEGSSATPPLLVLGGSDRMYLRVDVDEHDAWRVQPGMKAVAFVRGHPEVKIPLSYEYTEPQIIPKTSLTGQSTERTDTRVLQILYSFAITDAAIHIGQQLDVFIEAPANQAGDAGP